MKKLLLASAIVLAGSTANAGGLSDPIVTPTITPTMIVEDTVKSAGRDDWVVVVMTVLTIGLGVIGN